VGEQQVAALGQSAGDHDASASQTGSHSLRAAPDETEQASPACGAIFSPIKLSGHQQLWLQAV